jgi:hypothetical protein
MLWQEMRPLQWSEVSAPMKILRIVVIAAWLATLADFAAFHSIYDPARYQPSAPDAVYTYRIDTGHEPRFITDEQNHIYSVARPLGLGLWSFTAPTMGLLIFLEYRLSKKRKKQTMDRLLGDEQA